MKCKIFLLTLSFMLVLILSGQVAWGQIPQTMSYQGVLTDAKGSLVSDGVYRIAFKLYTAAEGGTPIWSETQSITVKDGLFNVTLGSVTPLDLPFDQLYWLAIAIGEGSELSQRMQLTSSAYSLQARTVADSAITSSKIASGQVVKSINSITDDIKLVPGENVRITQQGNSLIISARITDGEEAFRKGEGSGQMPIATQDPPFLFIENIFPAPEQHSGTTLETFPPLPMAPQTSDLFDWNGQSPVFLQLIFELGNRGAGQVQSIEIFANDVAIPDFKVSKVEEEGTTGAFKKVPTTFAEEVSPDFRFKLEFMVPFELPDDELKVHLEVKSKVSFKDDPPLEENKFVTLLNNQLLGSIREIKNTNNTLDVINPNGPTTTINIKDDGINTTQLADGAVTTQKLATNAVTSVKIADGSVSTADITPNIVSSIDGVSNDGGNIDLVAGANITIAPDDAGDKITISAAGADNDWIISGNDMYSAVPGKVGIGTATPGYNLHVAGTINADAIMRARQAVIHDGVGTTQPDPPHALHVKGRVLAENAMQTAVSVRNRGYDLWIDEAFGMELQYVGPQPNSIWGTALYARNGSQIRFGHYPANSGRQGDFSPKMVIDPSGNVGIGTIGPTARLHIGGTAGVDGVRFPDGTLQTTAAIGGPSPWSTSGSDIFYNSGNVGIGTPSPGAPLEVVSDNTGSGVKMADFRSGLAANGNTNYIKIGRITTVDGATFGYQFNTASSLAGAFIGDFEGRIQLFVQGNGKVGIGTTSPDQLLSVNGNASKVGGGSWATFSDMRLKTIQGTYEAGLQEILSLLPIRYRYNQDNPLGIPDQGEHIGISAQEVQKVIPDAVSENSQGYLMVDNDPILWAMLNAIKEQQKIIAELKGRIEKHQAQNLAIKSELNQIKSQLTEFDGLKAKMAKLEDSLQKIEVLTAKLGNDNETGAAKTVVLAEVNE